MRHVNEHQVKELLPYVMDMVSKLTIVDMNDSLTIIARICFQSVVSQFSIRHTDSKANLTAAGGFAIDLTSDNCDFLMPLTATQTCRRLVTCRDGTERDVN